MDNHNSGIADSELVLAAKNNPDDFGGIVDRYWNRLFSFIRRLSFFSQEDIEDILQEVFIKVYRYLNDYDEKMAFSTWIYQIARNCMIDEIRKRNVRPASLHLEAEELVKVMKSSLDVEKEFQFNDSLDKLKNLIYELPFKYREVLVLRFLEEKSYEEIMDILKIPKGTVAALINRGRKILMEKAKTLSSRRQGSLEQKII